VSSFRAKSRDRQQYQLATETGPNRAGGLRRDLLGNDGPHEHSKPVPFEAQRERANGVDHGLHHGIGCPKMTVSLFDGFGSQFHGAVQATELQVVGGPTVGES